MWCLVFRKSSNADVTIFEDERMAAYFARVKKAPVEKFQNKEKAVKRSVQLGYAYHVEYMDEYVSERPPEKKTTSDNRNQTNKLGRKSKKKKVKRSPGDYQKYIASPEWKKKRDERIKLDNNQCQICGSKTKLEVHHLTYDRVFQEDMDDLITLCDRCHRKVHGMDSSKSVERKK